MISRKKIGLILIGVAVAIAIHHYMAYGKWFDIEEVHHEQFMVSFLVVGLSFLLVT